MLLMFLPTGVTKVISFTSKYFWNMDIVTDLLKSLNLTLQSAIFNILSKAHDFVNKKYTA